MSKNSWPEVVGMSGEEAQALVEAEEGVKAQLVPAPGGVVPKDLAMSRVRIYVDNEGKVVEAPKRG
ncbi:pathogenesisrelated protein PR-6 type, putative [Acanthamoeba castellanii str. Neff]|uniref:Pathogenesisrelated protein PR-6 type, putative n=1 Tax=Acanthamoeba castellanii (strain ATCC 30010 / Neff) TaxID=1257118 RepID=L8HAM4_ACACF|nr:pathogenesisrelated protein PR-6 type, putative [Acanthamoeba castellanii str. Neff]ELR21471.1 pathogenesisrelated protein PR-6 type, putative [Acanthamoeba castellanii str. Neff]